MFFMQKEKKKKKKKYFDNLICIYKVATYLYLYTVSISQDELITFLFHPKNTDIILVFSPWKHML